MANDQSNFKIFYDGACYLCSTEIDHYKKKKTTVPLEYIDISTPDFKAAEFELDHEKVNQEMHVQKENGEIKTGVEAFFEIWRRIPSYQKCAWALDRNWIKPVLKIGYFGFARLRPYLPKRRSCEPCDSYGEKKT